MSETLLDQLARRLRQALSFNENAEVAPVALLWPDRSRQFVEVARQLRLRVPLLTLGDLNVSEAAGPAYWLRCAIAGTVNVYLAKGTPVVYLPGVGRDDLRAIEDCPRELAPIAELQYRSEWFVQRNGRDWTVRALLSNPSRGLGLDVAEDPTTLSTLLGVLGQLMELPMRRLSSERIDADFLLRLLNPDPAGALLEWVDDPSGFRSRLGDERWRAFVEQSKREYGFDPAGEGEVTGGRRLGERDGQWAEVWRRFEQNPEQYQGVEARLRMGRPSDQLFAGPAGAWPQDNEDAEARLRGALRQLSGVPADQARESIAELWKEHNARRHWVWAKLDRAPLVFALEQLHRLSQRTTAPGGDDASDLVARYTKTGWQVDDAFLAALQTAGPAAEDREAVVGAGKALYWPWLSQHATAFQKAVGALVNAGAYTPGDAASTAKGTVTVFVDGLRLDLGHRLAERLANLDTTIDVTLAALPTVTDTTKPVLSPVPDGSLVAGPNFAAARAGSGAKANVDVLRSLMNARGIQVLKAAELGDPSGCAWTEAGDIDTRGHQFQAAFVDEIDGELDRIAKRVRSLLDGGWQQVDVVTDHGWLLLPGGFEKVDLPAATVEKKKGRCARLKDGADVSVPTVSWHWDRNVQIAIAPGVSCFEANQEYEHGGVSLQECGVPRLRVRVPTGQKVTGEAAITKVKWLGLMCRIEVENVPSGATVDIRASAGKPTSSVAAVAKETTGTGRVSLIVTDEDLERESAYVVIVAGDGTILAQRDVIIGSNR